MPFLRRNAGNCRRWGLCWDEQLKGVASDDVTAVTVSSLNFNWSHCLWWDTQNYQGGHSKNWEPFIFLPGPSWSCDSEKVLKCWFEFPTWTPNLILHEDQHALPLPDPFRSIFQTKGSILVMDSGDSQFMPQIQELNSKGFRLWSCGCCLKTQKLCMPEPWD